MVAQLEHQLRSGKLTLQALWYYVQPPRSGAPGAGVAVGMCGGAWRTVLQPFGFVMLLYWAREGAEMLPGVYWAGEGAEVLPGVC